MAVPEDVRVKYKNRSISDKNKAYGKNVEVIQKMVFLGTTRILRKVLRKV